MKERMQKISTLSDNCRQKDRTESESYARVQTFIGITENHLVEVQFTKEDLLERILSPANMNRAYKQVMSNGGSEGVDKMEYELINSLLEGSPTVVDRFIQQSISQVLSPLYERQFSDNSFGFHPNVVLTKPCAVLNLALIAAINTVLIWTWKSSSTRSITAS
jgi:hypothetical protein